MHINRKNRILISSALLAVFVTLPFFVIYPFVFSSNNTIESYASTVPCPNGNGWKKFDINDNDMEVEYTADNGKIVTEVCVFGGNNIEYFSINETKSCWIVSGIGSQTAKAKENWTSEDDKGRGCRDISNVSFLTGNIPSATPTQVPVNTATPTNMPENTPTPTDVPVNTPTLSPTPGQTVEQTPTPTQIPEVTPTVSDEATPTATQSVALTATPTPTGEVAGISAESDPEEEGKVLGISALAATGATGDKMILLGSLITIFSLYAISAKKILSFTRSN